MDTLVYYAPVDALGVRHICLRTLKTRIRFSNDNNGRSHSYVDEIAQLFQDKNALLNIERVQTLQHKGIHCEQ